MVPPEPSSFTNAFRFVGFCCLLLCPIGSSWAPGTASTGKAVREQEVLYAQLPETGVEYFFIPRNKLAVTSLGESRRLGLTEHGRGFVGKARSLEDIVNETIVMAYGYVPYTCWNTTDSGRHGQGSSVLKAQIFRVAEGKTSEYIADVVYSGGCFERIEAMPFSFRRNEIASREAPQNVKDELRQICDTGFAALKPSSRLPKLDGVYIGSRDGRSLKLSFYHGAIIGADLVIETFAKIYPFVTYHPLCDGIISLITRGRDREDLTLVILKKARGYKGVFWEHRREETVLIKGYPLCEVEDCAREQATAGGVLRRTGRVTKAPRDLQQNRVRRYQGPRLCLLFGGYSRTQADLRRFVWTTDEDPQGKPASTDMIASAELGERLRAAATELESEVSTLSIMKHQSDIMFGLYGGTTDRLAFRNRGAQQRISELALENEILSKRVVRLEQALRDRDGRIEALQVARGCIAKVPFPTYWDIVGLAVSFARNQ
ncbi:hypothetical protein FOZ60_003096 [Perkinsus olseni]|uniref:Uncharacterized protein n=1 Tax=Perkinsus olseni TaxID=32597 RepID=A0A7J6PIZ7_PEROL|nr:hypothetical protein FOZ60_003096 [Perkinsus olseni]